MLPDSIPLFPLSTVLCPGGVLPLRIFEPRYVDMVRDCLQNDTGFGVILITSGHEVGPAAQIETIGTFSRITDFDQSDDGLLAITATGERRFVLRESTVSSNELRVGQVEYLPEPETTLTPERFHALVEILQQMLTGIGPPWSSMKTHYENADWLANRLTELLPIGNLLKQAQLEQDDPIQCLEYFQGILEDTNRH